MRKKSILGVLLLGFCLAVALPAGATAVTTDFSGTESHTAWDANGGLGFTGSPMGNFKGIVNFSVAGTPSSDYQTILQSDKPVTATIVFDQFYNADSFQFWDETLTLSYTFDSGPALDSNVTDGFALFTGEFAGELVNASGFDVFLNLADLQDGNTTGIFNFILQLAPDQVDSDAMDKLGAPLSGNVTLQQTSVPVPAPSMLVLFGLLMLLTLSVTSRRRPE